MKNNLFNLENKVGIITGGTGILGSQFVPEFLKHGTKVVAADVDEVKLKEMRERYAPLYGDSLLCIHCDVSNPQSVKNMVQKTIEQFSGIDFLLNNAATAAADPKVYYAAFEEYELAEWRRVMAINLDGMFLVAQAVGKQMVQQGRGGSIIQTSSIYGTMASDNRIYKGSTFKDYAINNPAIYSASKAGVVGLTRWLATYWAEKNIRVNAVAPGGVFSHENENFTKLYSNRIPMGRMAHETEITGTMLYLASDASTYVTGQCIMVDGGLSAW
jgi:NAD(P)-dependent dehydrogenase (short-subunit alcohol dehydrogenase family)